MPTDIVTLVKEWLDSLVGDEDAAALFAESADTSLASHGLSRSDLDGVDLHSVAGGIGGPGISSSARQVLTQFQNSAPAPNVTPVQEVAVITREAHRENPVIQRIFQDNSVNIDNSQTFVNNGVIDGDITFDNDVTLANGEGAVALGEGAEGVIASGDGSVAAGRDANLADDGSQIIQDSEIGANANNSDGSVLAGEVEGANSATVDDESDESDESDDESDEDQRDDDQRDDSRPEDRQREEDGQGDREDDDREPENKSDDEQEEPLFGKGAEAQGPDGQQTQSGDSASDEQESQGGEGLSQSPEALASDDPSDDPGQGEPDGLDELAPLADLPAPEGDDTLDDDFADA